MRFTPAALLFVAALTAAVAPMVAGCDRSATRREAPAALPVNVLADTGELARLHVRAPDTLPAPRAAVWLTRVTPVRPAPVDAPLPEPEPATLEIEAGAAPALELDEDLKPPLPRQPAPRLFAPRAGRGSVELDVRVDESGAVSDALWAGGSSDSALVRAATDCALAMRFYPAQRGGRSVAVWCRQRFDFGKR